jgi:uncharacterized Zn-binding protein involved in type VI secretion
MPGVARAYIDTAGGTIIQGSPDVIVNGLPAARLNDAVAGHGIGPHAGPVMASGSGDVIVNGLPLCRAFLDVATCGDPASGSSDVFCN